MCANYLIVDESFYASLTFNESYSYSYIENI